jgi:hypothetical protein
VNKPVHPRLAKMFSQRQLDESRKLLAEAETQEDREAHRAAVKEGLEAPQDYQINITDSKVESFVNRILIATPTLGTVRMEWVQARYGQIVPTNWSQVMMTQFMNGFIPMHYQVADAQNIIAREVVEKGYEWLLLIEDDTVLPPDALIRFNEYMRTDKFPVVSGLYFTRTHPSEPMVYRGRGNSFYTDWKYGDVVMCDGVPTGALLINAKLIKALWDDSEDYEVAGTKTRRVFDTPRNVWFDEAAGISRTSQGTSDLDFCTRVIEGGYLTKAGYPDLDRLQYPFVVDTRIFCKHIERSTGEQFPF